MFCSLCYLARTNVCLDHGLTDDATDGGLLRLPFVQPVHESQGTTIAISKNMILLLQYGGAIRSVFLMNRV